eukprot:1850776-Amphidinium_carterae.1
MHLTSSPRADHVGWCVPCFHGSCTGPSFSTLAMSFPCAIRRPVVKSLKQCASLAWRECVTITLLLEMLRRIDWGSDVRTRFPNYMRTNPGRTSTLSAMAELIGGYMGYTRTSAADVLASLCIQSLSFELASA